MKKISVTIISLMSIFVMSSALAGPLHDAVNIGDIDQVKLLIIQGANINTKDNNGLTPLHIAAGVGHKPIAELLIAQGANVNAKNNDGYTPLHIAAVLDHKPIAELLIAQGANVNAKDNNGLTPLHMAAVENHQTIGELLIAQGASVNAKNNDGVTPLHVAAFKSHQAMAELLIAQGANVNAKDNNGFTPLDVAVAYGHQAMVELLRRYVADATIGAEYNEAISQTQKKLKTQIAAESQTLYVKAINANFRSSPTTKANNILDVLPQGTPVETLERKGIWHKVKLKDGRIGWMSERVLISEKPEETPTEAKEDELEFSEHKKSIDLLEKVEQYEYARFLRRFIDPYMKGDISSMELIVVSNSNIIRNLVSDYFDLVEFLAETILVKDVTFSWSDGKLVDFSHLVELINTIAYFYAKNIDESMFEYIDNRVKKIIVLALNTADEALHTKNYDVSIDKYEGVSRLAKQFQEAEIEAFAYSRLSEIYSQLGDNKTAVEYEEKAQLIRGAEAIK